MKYVVATEWRIKEYGMSVKFFGFWILHFRFTYLVWSFLDFGFGYSFYILSCVDLVSIDAQVMFKHDLDIIWAWIQVCPGYLNSRALCMVKNHSMVAWLCSQYITAWCPYTLNHLSWNYHHKSATETYFTYIQNRILHIRFSLIACNQWLGEWAWI